MAQNKKFFITLISLTVLSFLYCNSFALAALEIKDYPNILGLPKITDNSELPDFVSYWFGLLIYITGIVAIISFAIGAVQLAASSGSPEIAKNGKDRMKGSILGLILSLSAYTILGTINSSFVMPTLINLPITNGVYLTTGSKYIPTNQAVSDTSTIQQGYGQLFYKCNSGPAIIVWLFEKKGFDYNGKTSTRRITCGDGVNISSSGSFKWAYETPGIYYCMEGCSGNMCSGYMSGVINSSENEISMPFRGNIKGVRIVNSNSENYGVIFHKEIGFANGGSCTEPLATTNDSKCFSVNIPAFSSDIFKWNKSDYASSGSGITFYSKTYGWDADVQSGKFDISQAEIKDGITKQSKDMEFDYTNVDSEDAFWCSDDEYPSCYNKNPNDEELEYIYYGYCCPCKTFQECPGSIRIKGSYLVALYSNGKDENGKNTLHCQTFTEDVENLDAYEYTQQGELIQNIKIIPTK